MKTLHTALLVLAAGSAACVTAAPKELVDARFAYTKAASPRTQSLAPSQLDTAKNALAQAERAFDDDPKSDATKDLSYIAMRQAQLAEARAGIEDATRERARADSAATVATAEAAKEVKQELANTKNQLAEAKTAATAEQARQGTEKAEIALGEERKATARAQVETANAQAETAKAEAATAEAKAAAADALAALAKVASVKEEERGLVISLSGSVLFATGKSILLPGARSRLDQVAEALKAHPRQMITIEGHTDSVGSAATNQELSRARAQGVTDYLASRGVRSNHMQATGLGPSRPIADNGTADGRANNRRVEIVLSRENKFAEQ